MISKGKYKDKMMKVVAYLRISTTKQTSIREQKSIVKSFIQKNKYELVELITDEGVSGTSADRDGWNRVMDMVTNKKIDAVVGWELSRLGRGLINNLNLLKAAESNGVRLIGVSDGIDSRTQSGRLQLKLMSVVYENEAETIGRRLREIREVKKTEGKVYNGRLAYGMKRVGDKLVKCEDEIKNVRWIKNMKSRGHTLYKIAKRLNEMGVATKEGGKWQQNTIKRVMDYHYN